MRYRSNIWSLRTVLFILAISLIIGSCQETIRQPAVSGEVTFALSDTQWTYFSFESGEVVGTSDFGDDAQDAVWRERTDWDIAFCGDLIRTNSGTSGRGIGGIQRNTTDNFYSLTEAPIDGYITDTDDFPVYD